MKYIFDREKNVVRQIKDDYWVRIPQKWWREGLRGLKPIERCLLVSLRVWGAIRPSKSRLAKELSTTRKTITKYLKILKKKGFIG